MSKKKLKKLLYGCSKGVRKGAGSFKEVMKQNIDRGANEIREKEDEEILRRIRGVMHDRGAALLAVCKVFECHHFKPVCIVFKEDDYKELAVEIEKHFKTKNYPSKNYFRINDIKIMRGRP